MHLTISTILYTLILITFMFNVVTTSSMYPKRVLRPLYIPYIIFCLLYFAPFGIAALVAISVFKIPVKDASEISLGVGWTLIFLFILVSWIQSKKRSGKVLSDIDFVPKRYTIVFLAVLFIVAGFFDLISFRMLPWRAFLFLSIDLSIAVFFIITASSKLQVRKKGFVVYWFLRRWEKIESYTWSRHGKIFVLKLKEKGRVPETLRTDTLLIPFEKRNEVEALLKKYC